MAEKGLRTIGIAYKIVYEAFSVTFLTFIHKIGISK